MNKKTQKKAMVSQRPLGIAPDDRPQLHCPFVDEISKISLKCRVSGSDFHSRVKNLESIDKTHIWHPFTQMKEWAEGAPLIITEGRDCFIKDIRGRWYLDGVSSLWVNIFGHRKKEIDEAIAGQLKKAAHTTLLGLAGEASIELAGKLARLMEKSFTPPAKNRRLTRIFYSDNGSTAVEVSLKMAFQYWRQKGEKRKRIFVSLENGYHGDTLGAVSVGGVDIFHAAFGPLLFETLRAPSPYCYRCGLGLRHLDCGLACAEALEDIFRTRHDEIAAFIMEPLVQAAGGMIIHPRGYLSRVRGLCEKYGVLFIADEVATGFGRTGRMFACEHEGVTPDIICISKGITGGYLPLAATITNEEVYGAFLGGFEELKTFFHGHSYTGNPLACAAASAALGIFGKEKVLEGLPEKTELLAAELKHLASGAGGGVAGVGEAKNLGLMGRIELVKDRESRQPYDWGERIGWKVANNALEGGLFIRPLGNVIVIMPPLAISPENLKRMMDVIRASIEAVTGR
ncbi:MAG: adenosylmethionine--8-amino-7-oxononanoate transaminase [Nitrospiraceae bacterium]|nr:adenosylmethionine--8-amino-7-oxononanoate transaminase [Nitrospiraceae bacterium]